MAETVPCSFRTLHRHSIFQPTASSESEWELVSPPNPSGAEDDLVPAKKGRVVTREKEVILATGKEVRLASLSGEGFEMRNGNVGKYSTLSSAALTFDILSVALNPTGRLLAVVGRSQIVVLVLPRSGSATRGQVACRSITIDAPQYAASSASAIAKVRWHPLGQNGESLWILSSDGQLREYDIQSPHDPIQTFSFLPPSPASSSRFSAADPLSRIATSFTFGPPTGSSGSGSGSGPGWGELIIYGLLANGDVYTLCPVLPFRCEVSLKWIQRLRAYVQETGSEEERYWLDMLSRQVHIESSGAASSPGSPSVRVSILGRSTRKEQAEKKEEEEVNGDQLVQLHPPHLTKSGGPAPGLHMELERQGPAVFDPAGPEGDEEDVASDLMVVAVGAGGDGKEKEGVRVIGVCWCAARVDVGVEVGKVQGRWAGSSRSKPQAISKIPIVESIQLDLPIHLAPDNAPLFTSDPLHPDTFYVQHIAGVDAISVQDLVTTLLAEKGEISGCSVAQLVSSSGNKSQQIEGLATCYDFSLGYGVLALSSSNRLAGIELDYRSSDGGDAAIPSKSDPKSAESSAGSGHAADTASLLLSHPIDIDHLLRSTLPSPSLLTARSALDKLSTARIPLETVSHEHLRSLVSLIAALQIRIEAVRSASAAVERHLDLQVSEFQRQVQLLQTTGKLLADVKGHQAIERADGMMRTQEKLVGRMDGVLGGLMGLYRPPVAEVEKRWFEELEAVKGRVQGGKGFGLNRGGGMQAQVDDLEDQLEEIKPSIEAANAELQSQPARTKRTGAKQIRPIESALYQKMDEIGRLMRKMEGLKVEVEEALEGGSS